MHVLFWVLSAVESSVWPTPKNRFEDICQIQEVIRVSCMLAVILCMLRAVQHYYVSLLNEAICAKHYCVSLLNEAI